MGSNKNECNVVLQSKIKKDTYIKLFFVIAKQKLSNFTLYIIKSMLNCIVLYVKYFIFNLKKPLLNL